MLETYTISEGHCISLPELQQDISKVTGQTCSLHELGRLVKYALPWATKVKKVDGLKTRANVYKDFGISVGTSHVISWENLKNYVRLVLLVLADGVSGAYPSLQRTL
jgi:hypothetical protein